MEDMPRNELPAETPVADRAPVEQLLSTLMTLDEQKRRWRSRFLGAALVLGVLFAASVLQYAGTFATCRLLDEARREVEQLRNDQGLNAVREEAQRHLEQVTEQAANAAVQRDDMRRLREEMREEAKAIRDILAEDVKLRRQVYNLLKQRRGEKVTPEDERRWAVPVDHAHEGEPKKPLVCPDPSPRRE